MHLPFPSIIWVFPPSIDIIHVAISSVLTAFAPWKMTDPFLPQKASFFETKRVTYLIGNSHGTAGAPINF